MSVIRHQSTTKSKQYSSTMYGIRECYNPLFKLNFDLNRFESLTAVAIITSCTHTLCRSTPIECLHTILLGPVKYLLALLMDRLGPAQKDEIEARINSLHFSGFDGKLHGKSICR